MLGLALGLYSTERSVGVPLVSALITVPEVALLPLFIVWLGIGEWSKIMIISFGVCFHTVVSSYGSADNVSKRLIRMARSFEVNNASIVRKVVLPAALPGILSGFRVSTSIGIILLVTAEMIGSNEGIGAFILAAGNLYQVDRLLAGVVLLCTLGLTLSAIITMAEKRWLDWR
jgi:sulfonate transport system permease protein